MKTVRDNSPKISRAPTVARTRSLRSRLLIQLFSLAAIFAVTLYTVTKLTADRAAQASQDSILGAAVAGITDGLRTVDDGIEADLAYSTFSMLGAMGEERIFYQIKLDGETITGYDDLPPSPRSADVLSPIFYSASFRGADLRIATMARILLVDDRPQRALVSVGQTRHGQAQISGRMAGIAAMIGLGVFLLALPLTLVATGTVLRPIRQLAGAVGRRGPNDLRPVRAPTPTELMPLVSSLNLLITRLRNARTMTETFIFEAAHRIRTPLSVVRNRTELTLRASKDRETRDKLRQILRAVDDSSRSASQILDHAMVMYRSDQMESEEFDLVRLISGTVRALDPVAELRDISFEMSGFEKPCSVSGDSRMVEVALRNILDNAIKYSDDEGVIRVALFQEVECVTLTVHDTGRGLDCDVESLTSPFSRGKNVGDIVGSGLGLTIVDRVAAAHKGRFTLKTNKGGGTCAEFSLPLV